MTALEGRVALVTGAQKGIGAAVARELGSRGASVVVNHLDDEAAAAAVVADIERAGASAVAVAADVSSREQIVALVEAGEAFGGIDLLVNNAGIFPRVPLVDMTDDDWDLVFDVNLKAVFRATQLVASGLIERGKPGAVVNLSSVAAYRGSPLGTHYSATKGGVVGFTRAAALELAPQQIRVNAIAPGLVDTDQPRDGMTEEQVVTASSRVPLGRMATPADIARVACFLLGDDAGHITGEVIHVNGGSYTGG